MGPEDWGSSRGRLDKIGMLVSRSVGSKCHSWICDSGQEKVPLFSHFLYFNMEEHGQAGVGQL